MGCTVVCCPKCQRPIGGKTLTASILINGEVFAESDATAYLIAHEMLRGGDEDLGEAVDHRSPEDPGRQAQADRFGPIAAVVRELEERMGHEPAIAWLVASNPRFDSARPLDLLGEGDAQSVLDHIAASPLTGEATE
jgi:hypothetical protein